MPDESARLEPPIKAVLDATNKGDSRAFVAAFTKDGAVNDWGEVHTGRGEIAKWDKSANTGLRTRVRVTGVSRLAGEVLVLLEVTRGEDGEGQTKETGTWSFRLKGANVASLDIG